MGAEPAAFKRDVAGRPSVEKGVRSVHQNGMSSSKSSNLPPLLAAGFEAAGREPPLSSAPPASAPRLPPPMPGREPSICIWLATISVEYLSFPSLSCHL